MSSGLWMTPTTGEKDYEFGRVLAGEAEALRARLAEAAKRLGFQVLSQQPLVARRRGRGGGRTGCSADILEYPAELVITLKPLSDAATHATFSYTVKNYHFGAREDALTLECETQALAALARGREGPSVCPACGADIAGDSRFCRRCGAPLVSPEPAEVELLRLSGGTRAAYKSLRTGALAVLSAAAVAFVLMLVGSGKMEELGERILSIAGVAGLFVLALGLWRLHRTLNHEREETNSLPAADAWRGLGAARTVALPHAPEQASVAERTTELLEQEKVGLKRQK